MALNPPCAPCEDTGVLLACLKVRDCEVIEICNLHRRFVMTPVALRYWSSFGAVERFAERLCCGEVKQVSPPLGRQPDLVDNRAPPTNSADELHRMTSAISTIPATQLKAMTTAFAGMYPRGSLEATAFTHMAEAFALFAGEKIEQPAKPATDLSDAARTVIEETVVKRVKAEVNANMEEALIASDPVRRLQAQIEELKTQLVALGKPVRKPPSGEPQ
jgi:hypothetical protein